jgi:hypothetical protein
MNDVREYVFCAVSLTSSGGTAISRERRGWCLERPRLFLYYAWLLARLWPGVLLDTLPRQRHDRGTVTSERVQRRVEPV